MKKKKSVLKLNLFCRCTCWARQPSELSGCHRGRHGSVYWILGQFPQDLELKIQKFKIIILKRKKKKRQFIFFCPFEISRSVSAKRKKISVFLLSVFKLNLQQKKGLQCIYKKSTVSFCKLISQVVPKKCQDDQKATRPKRKASNLNHGEIFFLYTKKNSIFFPNFFF